MPRRDSFLTPLWEEDHYDFVCVFCFASFTATRTDATYCSPRCARADVRRQSRHLEHLTLLFSRRCRCGCNRVIPAGQPRRQFATSGCRVKYWRAGHQMLNRVDATANGATDSPRESVAPRRQQCPACRRVFTASRRGHTYCSVRCRVRASRQRAKATKGVASC